jgi:hypothetical protein
MQRQQASSVAGEVVGIMGSTAKRAGPSAFGTAATSLHAAVSTAAVKHSIKVYLLSSLLALRRRVLDVETRRLPCLETRWIKSPLMIVTTSGLSLRRSLSLSQSLWRLS